jgi:uncharacterized protein (DUF885 family)
MKTALSIALTFVAGSLLAAAAADDPADRLHDLFDREWKWRLAESPQFATSVGVHDYDDRLGSVSAAVEARRAQELKKFLGELSAIPTASLSNTDRINAEIFGQQLERGIESIRFREYEIPLSADWGFHTSLTRLPEEMPFQTIHDYENYTARLNAISRYVDEEIGVMKDGLARGMTLP